MDIDIRPCDAAQETRLAHVGVTADEQGSSIRVDGRQTSKMLSDLIEIQKGIFETLDEGGHATECSSFQLLALKERLAILDQPNIVSGNSLDQVFGGRELAESDAEMVGIVEGIEKIFVERMDVLKSGKTLENGTKFLGEGLLRKLDLSGVERYF